MIHSPDYSHAYQKVEAAENAVKEALEAVRVLYTRLDPKDALKVPRQSMTGQVLRSIERKSTSTAEISLEVTDYLEKVIKTVSTD